MSRPCLARVRSRLFPESPRRPASLRGVLLAAGAVGAAAVVSLLRQPGGGALDTVWAEDGTVFLGQAVRLNPVEALVTPYNGYFHSGRG